MTSLQSGFANLTAHQRPVVGDLKMSVVNVDHLGWLVCDGRSVAVDDFLFLFNVIGYSFGGSGPTFNLPNPAGRVPGILGRGQDLNPTLSTATYTLGGNYGEYNHLLTIAEIPSHNHDIPYTSTNTWGIGSLGYTSTAGLHTHNMVSANDDFNNTSGAYPNYNAGSFAQYDSGSKTWVSSIVANGDHQHVIYAEGGSQYHNNIQPTIGIGNMFIYSGRATYPTIFNQSYNGWQNFYQGVTPGVYLPNPPLQ